jgi:hypothetical protein
VVPPPMVAASWLALIVLGGIWLGHALPNPFDAAALGRRLT